MLYHTGRTAAVLWRDPSLLCLSNCGPQTDWSESPPLYCQGQHSQAEPSGWHPVVCDAEPPYLSITSIVAFVASPKSQFLKGLGIMFSDLDLILIRFGKSVAVMNALF